MHVGIADPLWREKRSRNFRSIRNTQFYVGGNKPMACEDMVQLQTSAYIIHISGHEAIDTFCLHKPMVESTDRKRYVKSVCVNLFYK